MNTASTRTIEIDLSSSELSGLEGTIKPKILGDFSLFKDEFWDDRRHMKFFNDERFKVPGTERYQDVKYDLKISSKDLPEYNYDPDKGLRGLLRWIMETKYDLSGTDFVGTRHTLRKILDSSYSRDSGFELRGTKLGRVIYLHDVKKQKGDFENPQPLAGHKFESLMTTDEPSEDKAPKVSNNQNDNLISPDEKLKCALSLKMGKVEILYSAEIDGYKLKKGIVKPKDDLDLAKDGQFVEFKTSNNNSPRTFQNFKYPNWWIQAFLGHVQHVIVGFKTKDFVVENIKEFDIDFLERSSPLGLKTKGFNYLNKVLTAIKDEIKEEHKVYKISTELGYKQISIRATEEEQFIPDWYGVANASG